MSSPLKVDPRLVSRILARSSSRLPLADPMARRPHVLHPRRGVEPFAGACFKEDRADAGGGVGVVWRARVGARASQRRRCRCSTTRPSGSAMARPAAPRHPARDSRRAPRRRERRQWPGRTVPTHCRPVWDRARTTELVRPHRLAARSMVACYSSQDTVSSAATVSVSCVSISTWPGRSTVTVIPGGGRGQHPHPVPVTGIGAGQRAGATKSVRQPSDVWMTPTQPNGRPLSRSRAIGGTCG